MNSLFYIFPSQLYFRKNRDHMKLSGIEGTVELSNGYEMPYLGLGVFLAQEGDEVINAVQYALQNGYRHIDTAALYENEIGVGRRNTKKRCWKRGCFRHK